jgi:outer membrane lipoprotein-sorting protein
MRRFVTAVVAAAAGLLFTAGESRAQDQTTAAPAVPVGATNQSWAGTVSPQQVVIGQTFEERQVAVIKIVSAYFNELNNLKGWFVQTDPDKRQYRGKFYVKRPGRFRFDYSAPNRKVIISDGDYLAIQDRDLNNEDVFELDRTPFRLLLRRDVDLLRDARIVHVEESEDLIIVALQDKSPDAPGRITLYLTKKPTLELKQWVTTDAQGLETRVELSELVKTDDVDANLFNRDTLLLKRIR